jgi:hypothetical protein
LKAEAAAADRFLPTLCSNFILVNIALCGGKQLRSLRDLGLVRIERALELDLCGAASKLPIGPALFMFKLKAASLPALDRRFSPKYNSSLSEARDVLPPGG